MPLTLANKITIFRIVLIPFLVGLLLSYTPQRDWVRWWGLCLYLLAELSDVADGYIARRYRQKTVAGSILDPLADKLLLISMVLVLCFLGDKYAWDVRLPFWLACVFIARETVLLIGGLLLEVKRSRKEIMPNGWGKATAFLQACCVALVLLQWRGLEAFGWAAVFVSVVSVIIYVKEGVKVLHDGNG